MSTVIRNFEASDPEDAYAHWSLTPGVGLSTADNREPVIGILRRNPGMTVRAACAALTKLVNFMVAIRGRSFSVAELQDAGVKRISLATSLYRAEMTGLLDAAHEVADRGTFGHLDQGLLTTAEINVFFRA
ncbi:MAG: isocitrate lyase/phosphoenolpyruvate mutase family protein [Ideonella sp.]|nr:isocitrate lyase/phosphoenolpyruvate mutase family protein [Ideonella sp.]